MIPNFDVSGRFPAGVHSCTWRELEEQLAFNPARRLLLAGLKDAARVLQGAGCRNLYIDGSFATTLETPGDFDGCWSTEGVDADLLDPVLLDFSYGRLFQKLKYRGELFPAEFIERKTGLTWLAFFQQDKETGEPKGILQINLEGDVP